MVVLEPDFDETRSVRSHGHSWTKPVFVDASVGADFRSNRLTTPADVVRKSSDNVSIQNCFRRLEKNVPFMLLTFDLKGI